MNNQLKLKFYYDFVLGQVYAEGESPYHREITQTVVKDFVDPLDLKKDSKIYDLGCGPGYFLDEMKTRGFTDITGITLSNDDIDTCMKKGHQVKKTDMNFLPDRDESVDFLFCRHSLEHSPFPYITLLEYNRVLKPGGYLYVEVPQPDCDRVHEDNRNHYSIMGKTMWLQLLLRSGFDVTWHDFGFGVTDDATKEEYREKYYIFVCKRSRPVDVK